MEVFAMIASFLLDIYINYVFAWKGLFSLFLPAAYITFFTAFFVNYVPIIYLSRRLMNLRLLEVMQHKGLVLYVGFIAFMWLWLSNNGNIGFEEELRAYTRSSLIAFGAGIYGVMAIRGRIYTIEKGIERGQKYRKKGKKRKVR